MITMHRGILKLKDILCGPGIESAISIHVLPPGWRKFVAVLTQPSPGSFELQGPFPFPQPQFHVLSCLPAPTLPELPDVGSSRPDPVLATGTTEMPLTWPLFWMS